MTKTTIRFKAKLFRPAETEKGGLWTFLTLSKNASAKLLSRGMTAIEGTINGLLFQLRSSPTAKKATGSKWIGGCANLRAQTQATLSLSRSCPQPRNQNRRVPADLRKALATAPKARALWRDITPIARRDWITRSPPASSQRDPRAPDKNACSMFAAGKRRVCCFDRSGFYRKSLSAPKAAVRR
jgi:hypothetical protein